MPYNSIKEITHTMKKALSVLVIVFMLAATFAMTISAAGPSYIWDFADKNPAIYNEDGTYAGEAGNNNSMDISYDAGENCMVGKIVGGDPYFRLPEITPAISGDANQFIKVKYKILGAISPNCSFYFTTDTISWSEEGSLQWVIDGDDEQWTEQILDMSDSAGWTGTVDKLRYDPLSAGEDGQVVYIQYVAIFASEADATAFDYAAYKSAGTAAPETTAPAETDAPDAGEANTAAETDAPATTTPAPQTADVFSVAIVALAMAAAAVVVIGKKSK